MMKEEGRKGKERKLVTDEDERRGKQKRWI